MVHRVRVFDQSASVRALLNRELGKRAGIACIGCSPLSFLFESPLPGNEVDALVIGLDHRQEEPNSDLFARVKQSEVPTVFLYPPGRAFPKVEGLPRHWLCLEKPRKPREWETFCSTLISALEGMEVKANIAGMSRSQRFVDWGVGRSKVDLIAMGGSAGGPEATGIMLKTIGVGLQKVTVLVVQHIGKGFEAEYVQWMSRLLPWANVKISTDGEPLQPGQVRIAGPGIHLEITDGSSLRLDPISPPEHGHRPSIDRLLKSVARTRPEHSAGVLLSGMGVDGVEGLQEMNRAGSLTMVQSRESCAVFGMPRVALERGAAEIAEPPEALGRILGRMIEVRRDQ